MKAIKLTFTFILILGAIVAAFLFINGGGTPPPPPLSQTALEDYRKQFEKDWEAAGDWDEKTYNNHCELIAQLGAQGYNVVSLNDLNTSMAVDVVYQHILKEWEKENCKKQEVERYMNAVSIIEKSDEQTSHNPSVKIIKDVNKVYTKAYNLAHKSLGINPQFDGDNWNSYSSYSSSIESQKNEILNSSTFQKYLSNISEIKRGLNDIPSKLSSGRKRFYEMLAVKIINYYGEITDTKRTRADLNRLRKVDEKFKSEYMSDSSISNLRSSFAYDVSYNEKVIKRQRDELLR